MALALDYKLTTTDVTSSCLWLVHFGFKARLLSITWDSAHSHIVSDTWYMISNRFLHFVFLKVRLGNKYSIKSQVNKIIRIKAEFDGFYAHITIKIFRNKTKQNCWPLQIKNKNKKSATSCLKDLSYTKSVQNPCGPERDRGFPANSGKSENGPKWTLACLILTRLLGRDAAGEQERK